MMRKIKPKFSDPMHQNRMNGIDDACRKSPHTSRAIADSIGLKLTHAQKYLKHMEENGYLKVDKSGGKGNTYISTHTFCMRIPDDTEKPRRNKADNDMPLRSFPNIKARRDPWLFCLHIPVAE